MIDLYQSDRHESPLQGRPEVRGDLDALADASIEIQQRLFVFFVVDDDAVDVTHVRLAVQRRSSGQLVGSELVDVLGNVPLDALARDPAREFLRQVRLASGPVIDAVERRLRIVRIEIELRRKQVDLLAGKIVQRDGLRHIER